MGVKLHNVSAKRLPTTGVPGHLYFVGDSGELFLATKNGALAPVTEFFKITPEGHGPAGRDGRDGVDGRDGKDGVSITGPVGPKGERGDVLYVGPAELAAAHKTIVQRRAKTLAVIADSLAASQKYPSGARALIQQTLNRVKRSL